MQRILMNLMKASIGQASAADSQKITKMNKYCSRAREVVNHIDSKLKRNLTERCDFSVN